MFNHNKAQQSSNRVHISWDILYVRREEDWLSFMYKNPLHKDRLEPMFTDTTIKANEKLNSVYISYSWSIQFTCIQ